MWGRDPERGDTPSEGDLVDARLRMVERQLRRRGVRDPRVLDAMATVPRERFVPPELRRRAYSDRALPIGEGQTISQPYIVARMAELLELRGDERVLEVGTGSGYGAAVLSRCCREVVTIERRRALAERARELLAELGMASVEVRVGDGSRGAPDRAPFGGVSVTATAHGGPPPALLDQLAPGAALVCPVHDERGERLMRYREAREESVAAVRFVPLVPSEEEDEQDRQG
jgi:protein-L-isoaspartate(D-aspartate) O-methyltransferase